MLASILLATPALAQPRPPSDKDKQVANDLVKKAIAKSGAGDHEAAIATYQQAYAIVPNSVLLSNIGAEYQRDGKLQEALRYFCMYLEKDPTGTNAPYATQQVRQLQIQLGIKSAELCTSVRPEPRPEPKPVPKEPVVEDEPEPRTPANTRSRPEVAEDEAPPARHDGGSGTLRHVGLAAGLTGAAAIGVGIFAGIKAQEISDEISAHDPMKGWGDIHSLEHRGQTYENVQIATLVAGGVLVTGGVIMFLVGRSSGSAEPARDKASISVAPTRNGLAVFGRF